MARSRSTTKAMLIANQTKIAEMAKWSTARPRCEIGTNIRRLIWFRPAEEKPCTTAPPAASAAVFESQVFLAAFDFNERPRRNAMRLIASGERPRTFAACSSEAEDLANSMSRRSSLNDQGLRAITEMILSSTQRQSRQADPCSLDGFAWVGPGLGEPGAEMDKQSLRVRNKQRGLS